MLVFAHELLALAGDDTFPLFVHRRNTYHTELPLIPALLPIQSLTQRTSIQAVVLQPPAPLVPIPGLYHVILIAKFLEPAVHDRVLGGVPPRARGRLPSPPQGPRSSGSTRRSFQ